MKNLDSITFEQSPWEIAEAKLHPGDSMSAMRFLTLLEGEDEDTVDMAFEALSEREILPDLSDLPKAVCVGEAAERLSMEQELAEKKDMIQELAEGDTLRRYLEDLSQIPVWGDIQTLAAEAAGGDEQAKSRLADLSLSRVVEIAREYVGYGVLLLDLIQEGSLGMWRGILNYQKGSFTDVRDWWIRFYMLRSIISQARQSHVMQHTRQAMEDYRAVDDRLLTELGRNPTIEEISNALHMTVEDGQSLQKMLENAYLLEKTKQKQSPPEHTPEEGQPIEDTAYFQMRQRIEDMLSDLPELDARILTLRFGLEGDLPLSAEETSRKLNILPEKVLEREAEALKKLRENN